MREEKYIDTSLTDEQLALFGIKSFPETEQYIQVNDTRYTLDEFNRVGDFLLGWELTDDQQVVLEWLKEEKTNSNLTAFDCIYSFIYGNPKDIVTQIWSELNEKEEGQVLEAFGKWAQEQEEE